MSEEAKIIVVGLRKYLDCGGYVTVKYEEELIKVLDAKLEEIRRLETEVETMEKDFDTGFTLKDKNNITKKPIPKYKPKFRNKEEPDI